MKKILALAIASAFAAPAFAATSNVDIYGKFSVSANLLNDQTDTSSDLQFTNNSSRIGFKGAEDLGGGLSAIWQVESSVNTDEGGGFGGGRNTFIGLKGGFGTFLMGKHDTPLKSVGRTVDMFGDGFADSRNVMGGGSDTRANNVAVYMTPNFSGFSLAAAYSTDLGSGYAVTGAAVPPSTVTSTSYTGDKDDSSLYNLSATYSNGPLYLGLAYGDGDGHEALGLGSHVRAAAGFTFGNFKVVGQYDMLDDDTPTVGNGDYDAWMLGGSFTMGAMVFKANYMTGEYDNSGVEPQQWTVGMDYNLSKRTTVYGLYVSGENIVLGGGAGLADQNASCATCDGDIGGFSVGVAHTF